MSRNEPVTVTPRHVAAAIACHGVIVTHASINVGWISVGPRWQYENGISVGWLKVLADHSSANHLKGTP